MAVKIKLKRVGKIHAPQYRIVIADSRTARNGRAIEEVGLYQPLDNPSFIKVESERIQYWLGVGAQPTDAVLAILKVTGDWQKFKGLPGAEGTLEVKEAKPSKVIAFEAAVKAAGEAPKTKPTAKPKLVAETPAADVVSEEIAAADEVVAEAVAETAAVENVVAEEAAAEALENAADEVAAEAASEENA